MWVKDDKLFVYSEKVKGQWQNIGDIVVGWCDWWWGNRLVQSMDVEIKAIIKKIG